MSCSESNSNLSGEDGGPVLIIVNFRDILELQSLESSAIVHLRFDGKVEVGVRQPGELYRGSSRPDRSLPSPLKKD